MKLLYQRNDNSFEATVESLPPKAIEYLLQYGWAQSLQDSIAGADKAKRAELMETDQYKELDAKGDDSAAQFLEDECALHVLAKLEARQKAIVEGTIGVKVGQPRDPITTLAREQIREALAKAGKKIDVKTKAGKAQFDKLVASHVEKNGDKLRAELARSAEADIEIYI